MNKSAQKCESMPLCQTVSLIKKVVPIQLRSQKLSKIANRWKSATYAILQKQSHLFVISRSSRTFCTSTIKVSLFLGVDSLLNFWLWRGNTHLFLLSNSKGLDFVANLHSIILAFILVQDPWVTVSNWKQVAMLVALAVLLLLLVAMLAALLLVAVLQYVSDY